MNYAMYQKFSLLADSYLRTAYAIPFEGKTILYGHVSTSTFMTKTRSIPMWASQNAGCISGLSRDVNSGGYVLSIKDPYHL